MKNSGSSRVRMADVSVKQFTNRFARAQAVLLASPAALRALKSASVEKGNAVAVAKIAGVLAAKRAHEFIPLAHPIPVQSCKIDIEFSAARAVVTAEVKTFSQTGCELEALLAAGASTLTLYDMAKSLNRGMEITNWRLLEKSGGRSGRWVRSGAKK